MAEFGKDMTPAQMLGEAERLDGLATTWEAMAQNYKNDHTKEGKAQRAEYLKDAKNARDSAARYRDLAGPQS